MTLTSRARTLAIVVAAALIAGFLSLAAPQAAQAATCATTPFGWTWDSSKTTGLTFDIPLRAATTPVTIEWGDGSSTYLPMTTTTTASQTHTYATGGVYNITMCGAVNYIGATGTAAAWQQRGFSGVTAITSFPSTLTSLFCTFQNMTNLVDVPNSIPTGVADMSGAFAGDTIFNDPDVTTWNTANVTKMYATFQDAKAFNQPIGSWDMGNVVTTRSMFLNAFAFNQPIGSWNVSKVYDPPAMFKNAKAFNQDIGAWNTGAMITLNETFSGALVFNNGGSDSIKNWNVSSVTDLGSTFGGAAVFNQPIGSWNTARVTTMAGTFGGATVFNQPLGSWNTGAATTMSAMFGAAKAFNQPIGGWNTAKVTNMSYMFSNTDTFNQPIGTWNTAAVTNMNSMFAGAQVMDQDLSAWTPSALAAGSNNGAYELYSSYPTLQKVLSTANYDKLLISWASKPRTNLARLGVGGTKYSCDAKAARATIAATTWYITDGGLLETPPTISTIVPGDNKLSVYFTAPTCIATQRTTYQYSLDGGATWKDLTTASLSSPIVISTGVVNGQEYPIEIRAKGWDGTGYYGPASDPVNATPTSGADVKAKNETSVYGAAIPTIGYTTTLASGDFVETVTCNAYLDNTSYTLANQVTSSTKPGTYVTRCTGSTTSGLGSTVNYVKGTYTVTKAPLTITAKAYTKVYGNTVTLTGGTDFTVSGLLRTDKVTSVSLASTGTGASAGVAGSPYTVTPSAAVGTVDSGVLGDWYSFTYNPGSITVSKAPALIVTATSYNFSDTDTAGLGALSVSYTASGFVGSEDFSTAGYTAPTCGVYDSNGNLKSAPYSTLTAAVYTVKCSGAAAANYDGITYSEGTLTVQPPNVSVTAKNASSAFGAAIFAPSPAFQVLGDLNGHEPTCGIYTDDTYSEAVTSATKPGTYVTHCDGDTANGLGLDIVYTDGQYTIAKAALTITARPTTPVTWDKTYGTAITLDDTKDFTVTGLVGGDEVLSLTLTTSGDVATAGVAGSPYTVAPSAALLNCECDITDFYDVTYVPGAITVAKKTLSVTADNVSLQVGAAVPTSYDASYTGWENGENDTSNLPSGWVAPVCTSSFNSTTPIGTPVAVTCSGGSADDYEFSFTSGTVSIGNPEVTVENTTIPAYETAGSTANVALSAKITHWAPGCKVTFTLNPSIGTASPYTVYTTASDDVSVSADLPVGVYDITTSVSEGCEGDPDTTGLVAVVPLGPPGAAHIDTYGVKYKDATTGKTIALDMEWLRKLVKVKNPATGQYESSYVNDSYYYWSIYGSNQYRIASKPFPGKVTLTSGANSATVSTWGRMECPSVLNYPVGSVPICSAVTNVVTLQKWVPTAPGSKYGSWVNVGDVLIVEKLAQGAWPYKCTTTACKTALPDYLAFQMRPVPGAATPTVIPAGVPALTDWVKLPAGSVQHKQM